MESKFRYFLTSLAVGILLLLTTSNIALSEVAIIANKAITLNSITIKEAKRIWLGKRKSMPGGGMVKLADLPRGNAIRKSFYSTIVKKKDKQLKAYWAKVTFTGKGYPPQVFDNDSAVIEWVANTPGAVGYVTAASVNDSVNVLLKK